tara:strand:- start:152924 stop:153619 length:696 start_codon:yes stop_codon:yes gene_type:complete
MPDFARFDTRQYPVMPVRDGYGDWAPTYEATVEDAMDLALLERITSVRWQDAQRIADLGCGTGRTGAWLRSKSRAALHGVDLTPEMLVRAKDRDIYEQLIESELASNGLPEHSFDLVTCCLVDEHLSELQPLYHEAARLLRPGGHYVHVGFHPFFVMKSGMPTHFEHPERGSVALATNIHLFSDHVRCGNRAGMTQVEMHERLVDDEWLTLKPKWQTHQDWPISFASVWRV